VLDQRLNRKGAKIRELIEDEIRRNFAGISQGKSFCVCSVPGAK